MEILNLEQISQNSYLIDISCQEVNRVCMLEFEKVTDRTRHTKHYLSKAEIKDYVMIDRKNVFDQQTKNLYKTIWTQKLLLIKEMIIQLVAYLIILKMLT